MLTGPCFYLDRGIDAVNRANSLIACSWSRYRMRPGRYEMAVGCSRTGNPIWSSPSGCPFTPAADERVAELTAQGAEVIHLVANEYGLEKAAEPLFIKDRMKKVHLSSGG